MEAILIVVAFVHASGFELTINVPETMSCCCPTTSNNKTREEENNTIVVIIIVVIQIGLIFQNVCFNEVFLGQTIENHDDKKGIAGNRQDQLQMFQTFVVFSLLS